MTDLHITALMLLAFVNGICAGLVLGQRMYRKTLLLCAQAGTAEKLPDGNFYYLVQEGKNHD